MACSVFVRNVLYSLQLIFFTFPVMFFQALFMSKLPSKSSETANVFQILSWQCSLKSISFSFLRLNLSISHFVLPLLIESYSLPFTGTT